MTLPSWVAPQAWFSFIELDKAVVLVIRLASFLWLWFRCVCPLIPSRNTYCLTWVSSLLLQQSAAAAPYLGRGVSPHRCPFWPWTWVAALSPPLPVQPPLLGCGVAPLGGLPWPRAWGSSSRALLCRRSLALSVAAPDLGRGVAPLGHASAPSVSAGVLLCCPSHWLRGQESACNTGDMDLIPRLGRSPGERNSNPLQYSCLKNSMDRGSWWATVHGVLRVCHDWATKTNKQKDRVTIWPGLQPLS